MLKYFLIILLGAQTVHAQVQLAGDKRLIACTQLLLDQEIPQLAEGLLEAHLGSYQMLLPTLRAAGTHKQAEQIFNWVDQFIAGFDDPVVRDMKHYVDFATMDDKELILCILSTDCKLRHNMFSRHLRSSGGPFSIGMRFRGETSPTLTQIIVANTPPENPRELAMWTSSLVSNLSRYATLKLLGEWVAANQSLIAKGHSPDSLFQLFVFGQKPDVDADFASALLESRSHRMILLFKGFYHGQKSVNLADSLIRNEIFKIIGESSPSAIHRLSLNPATVLEVGVEWAAQMKATIEKARELTDVIYLGPPK